MHEEEEHSSASSNTPHIAVELGNTASQQAQSGTPGLDGYYHKLKIATKKHQQTILRLLAHAGGLDTDKRPFLKD